MRNMHKFLVQVSIKIRLILDAFYFYFYFFDFNASILTLIPSTEPMLITEEGFSVDALADNKSKQLHRMG